MRSSTLPAAMSFSSGVTRPRRRDLEDVLEAMGARDARRDGDERLELLPGGVPDHISVIGSPPPSFEGCSGGGRLLDRDHAAARRR